MGNGLIGLDAPWRKSIQLPSMWVHSKSVLLRLKAKLEDFWESGHFHVPSSALPPHFVWHIILLGHTLAKLLGYGLIYVATAVFTQTYKNTSSSLLVSFRHS